MCNSGNASTLMDSDDRSLDVVSIKQCEFVMYLRGRSAWRCNILTRYKRHFIRKGKDAFLLPVEDRFYVNHHRNHIYGCHRDIPD